MLSIAILFLFLNCNKNRNAILKPSSLSLQPVNSYNILVPEPSGLSLGENNQTLWIVSDMEAKLFIFSF
jgi:hypothetical protein